MNDQVAHAVECLASNHDVSGWNINCHAAYMTDILCAFTEIVHVYSGNAAEISL
jgi:hypothetical protein